MEAIFQLLFNSLTQSTNALDLTCREVSERLTAEISWICARSQRIQTSGDVEAWAFRLGWYRLQQCLLYYNLGSRGGRVELQNTLITIISPYMTPSHPSSNNRPQQYSIEDFLQGFYVEALKSFRRESQMPQTYRPQNRLELAEYMAFTERYAKRRLRTQGDRIQQLIIIRVQSFLQQQP